MTSLQLERMEWKSWKDNERFQCLDKKIVSMEEVSIYFLNRYY